MYYILKVLSNPDNNNIAPQVENMGPGYNWAAPNSVTHISDNVPLIQPPNLQAFHLDPHTAFTDVISQAYIRTRGLLVSPAFVETIKNYFVQRYELYAAKVVLRGTELDYYWLHMTEKAEASLDYANSEFTIESIDGGRGETKLILSINDLSSTIRHLVETLEGQLRPQRLTFLPGASLKDLFCLDLPTRTFFVSSRLGDDLVGARLSGFDLVAVDLTVITS